MRCLRQCALSLTVCFAALAASTPASGQTGIVAAYGFNEGSGSTALDATGNGGNGTISGATWTVGGKYGGALLFDGSNDWVTIAHAARLSLTNGMTLEVWAKPSAINGWRTVIQKEASSGLSYSLYSSDQNGRPAVFIRRTSDIDATSTSGLSADAWVHLAATYDGVSLRLYVNGVQAASRAVTGNIVTSTSPLRIGGNALWGEYFSGLIDEVRIYNRALTASEIQADMLNPVGGGGPPLTWTLGGSISPASLGSGATVALTGTSTGSVSTDANGNYIFGGLTNGPYTITPSKNGVTFNPTNRAVAISGSNLADVNFTAAADTPQQAVVGQWGSPFEIGLVAVDMVLLHTGKVLMFSGSFATSAAERVWDPTTGNLTLIPNPYYNLFCAGHAQLPDGRILLVGGFDPPSLGAANANIFDPVDAVVVSPSQYVVPQVVSNSDDTPRWSDAGYLGCAELPDMPG